MQKRSITLAGHKTSLALEEAFWQALDQIAAQSGCTVPALISRIDAGRKTKNLSSAIRVFVLAYFRTTNNNDCS
ncbi:hypothetical protein MNBD_ALPHA12-2337 [hydrothermal vent metagenome]|uniref:Ribbon-helix-helix domain-containing protein n=1 Tax=hydrothermal vent metagenome TaxID=652676 RepID=A0A3B0TUK9_9ZZZZ